MVRIGGVFILLFSLSGAVSAQLIVNTVAGGKIRSGVPAQEVSIVGVGGIARDPAGNLVFSEPTRNVIRRINTAGTIETIAGTGVSDFAGDGQAGVSALLNNPGSVAYDLAGNLYVADNGNFRIRRIDVSGAITTVVGTGVFGELGASGPATSAQVGQSLSLAVDKTGNLYFAELLPAWARIRRVTTAGTSEIVAGVDPASCGYCAPSGNGGPASKATFSGQYPLAIAFDGGGNLIVGDGNRLRVINTAGTINQLANAAGSINALTADAFGTAYAAVMPLTGPSSLIQKISGQGVVSTIAGGGTSALDGPADQASLYPISALAVDGNGNVYFGNVNIRELMTNGFIRTVSSSAIKTAPDGTKANEAWLKALSAIAINPNGDLFIFEGNTDCLIRKVSGGTLSTVATMTQCQLPNGSNSFVSVAGTNQLAADRQGNVYGAGGVVLFQVTPGGVATVLAHLFARSSGNSGVAVDSHDRAYFADGSQLVRMSSDGVPENLNWLSNSVSAAFIVRGLGMDPFDNLYVAGIEPSANGTRVLRFDQSGKVTQYSGFNSANSITADTAGNIWVSAGALYRNATGVFTQMGLTGGFSGDGGPLVSATLRQPGQVAADSSGNIYVLDAGNERVRKITGSAPKDGPVISAGGIVNAASLAGGSVAKGELISIFGSNFGQSTLATNPTQNNFIPKVLGSTRVFFNGTLGAITAATANQINVFVPYGVTGTTVSVVVDVDGVASAPVSVPLAASALGLSSADASGTGQGAILNQDGSYNGRNNPAAAGSVISLFGTGEGAVTPALPDGALVISTPFSAPVASPISVTIGGQKAEVVYAASAPSLPVGVFQLNVRVPAGVAAGDAAVAVTLGSGTAGRQITVAVR